VTRPLAASSWRQYRIFVGHGLKGELADPERILSPILFAVTLLLLFAFAVGEIQDDVMAVRLYIAETFLTVFFALQVSFARLFDPDRSDRVFDVLRTCPVSPTAWFLAKTTLVAVLGAATVVPTMLAATFFQQRAGAAASLPLSWTTLGLAMGALAGLAPLGVLLSALTLKANSRQILYPLLYFPLTTPVLLAAVQASLIYGETGVVTQAVSTWSWLLLAFTVIYFTLGILLYGELVDEG
jgi:heme exporter protein B